MQIEFQSIGLSNPLHRKGPSPINLCYHLYMNGAENEAFVKDCVTYFKTGVSLWAVHLQVLPTDGVNVPF